ncbi:MAG: SHOCT domain-containing protein [Myxococcales bacterium]|nr:MAG: SHOCT domain-containing protein [Myxococcales bacterium]
MKYGGVVGATVILCLFPYLVEAHSPGALDSYGCHDDKRYGTYHCHRGNYQTIEFPSKSAMLKAMQGGVAPGQAKLEAESEVPKRESLLGPLIGERQTDQRAASTSEVIVPQGVERRLEVLKDLRDNGLISESEYNEKKKEILGTL